MWSLLSLPLEVAVVVAVVAAAADHTVTNLEHLQSVLRRSKSSLFVSGGIVAVDVARNNIVQAFATK